MFNGEQLFPFPLEGLSEDLSFSFGVREWRVDRESLVVSVSAPHWDVYWQSVQALLVSNAIVVSPELITSAGVPLDDLSAQKSMINNRLEKICVLSQANPSNTYLVGSATYHDGGALRNSAVEIIAGQIVAQAHKRTGATQMERNTFRFNALEPASLLQGTEIGVLVCADLATAAVFARPTYDLNRVLLGTKREHFVGTQPTLIHPDATSLIVLACWGVGGNQELMRDSDPSNYYFFQLRNLAASILRYCEKLNSIIVVDRLPIGPLINQAYTPTHPFNLCISRK